MSENVENVLRMENVTMQFGGVVAVSNLSLEVNRGEIVALIGPNGAGKTTAFNCVTGVYQPTNGRIEFMGQTIVRNHPSGKMAKEYLGENAKRYTTDYDGLDDPDTLAALAELDAKCAAEAAAAEDAVVRQLDAEKDEEKRKALYAGAEAKKAEIESAYAQPRAELLNRLNERAADRIELVRSMDPYAMTNRVFAPTPDKITYLGIARTFQNIRLFSALSVLDNVLIAKHMRAKQNVFSATLRLNRKEERRMREEAVALLEEQNLAHLKDEIAGSLPYGIQRRLEIARALATNPKLLLLDEPAAGMNPQETQELGEYIVKLRREHDLTILMIEHHMDLVMQFSDRIYVIDFGKLISAGTPDVVKADKRVIDAYLGVVE
ncbi:MAG TPA: ABC transporter ATP-binding protein [Candidatus Scatomorpha intestinavium]|uniref:ABC transporter ATP-binding protein n=1 Tax=Candidatus Scatomorpha intestinavium TaxID=2840922 RepID=A0A9D0ZED7_9FIRM|nr:ABC transporter ATP-binding protein [Candidatus Scatomorpha intestinavium]